MQSGTPTTQAATGGKEEETKDAVESRPHVTQTPPSVCDFFIIDVPGDGRCGWSAMAVGLSQSITARGRRKEGELTLLHAHGPHTQGKARELCGHVAAWASADKLDLPLVQAGTPLAGQYGLSEHCHERLVHLPTRREWLQEQLKLEAIAYGMSPEEWASPDTFAQVLCKDMHKLRQQMADLQAWLGGPALVILSHLSGVPVEVWQEHGDQTLRCTIRVNGFQDHIHAALAKHASGAGTGSGWRVHLPVRLLLSGSTPTARPDHFSVLQSHQQAEAVIRNMSSTFARKGVYNRHTQELSTFLKSRSRMRVSKGFV